MKKQFTPNGTVFTFCLYTAILWGSLDAYGVIRYVKPGGPGTAPYISWATAGSNLASAIAACNAGDTIWVAKGTYLPELNSRFTINKHIVLLGGFEGNETSVSQRNWKANTTVLKGNGSNVLVFGNSSASELDGFTVRDGVGWELSTPDGPVAVGAVLLNRVSIRIAHCNFINNSATWGGAIVCDGFGPGNASSPTIIDCVFSSNTASKGGAIYTLGNGGQSSPAITNCVFVSNTAPDGGAVFNDYGGNGKMTNCTFYANSPQAIYTMGGVLKVWNSIMWDGVSGSYWFGQEGQFYDFQNSLRSTGLSAAEVFKNPANLIGPDGIWGTVDDGLTLLPTSPAANAGNNAYVTDIDHDITGADRILFGTVDIGAYESASKLWYVDASNAGGGHDGLTWATAFNSLSNALSAATEGDHIWVARGTYQPELNSRFTVDKHIVLLGGFTGNETSASRRDWKNNATILKGNGSNLLSFSNSSASELDGFTIRDGEGWNPPTYSGTSTVGAVYLDRVSIRIAHCIFTNNTNASSGGAIFCNGEGSGNSCDPTIIDCVFSSNTAVSGGAIYTYGFNGQSNPAITNCVFVSNSASTSGGAVYNGNAGYGQVTNCTFYGNAPEGIFSAAGWLYVRNSILWEGTSGSNFEFYNNLLSSDLSSIDVFKNPANLIGPDGIWATADDGLGLRLFSPAVNTGNNDYVTEIDHDVVGAGRIRYGSVDKGAYEFITTRVYADSSNIGGIHDGFTWATAFHSLSDALAAAPEGSEIWVAKGTYRPPLNSRFTIDRHIVLLGGFAGNETLVSQRNWKENTTILKGNGSNLLSFSNSSASGLDGFTIRDGVGWDPPSYTGNSTVGAVYLDRVNIRIAHCNFINNEASQGGAIFCNGEGSGNTCDPEIMDCAFSSNTAAIGGAICTYGLYGQADPLITNCVFASNSATTSGGGVYNGNAGDGKVTNCTFYGNTPEGIHSSAGWLNVRNSILWDGTSGDNFYFQNNLLSEGLSAADVFKNPTNLIGPDAVWATADDGLSLRPSTPAVNTGNNDYITGSDYDIVGAERIVQGTVDLGAYECPGKMLYVDSSNIEGVHNGLSWATAFYSLSDALAVATEGDHIWAAKGTYLPEHNNRFTIDKNIVLLGGFAGNETGASQRNWKENVTILKGNGSNVIAFSGSSNSELDGFTVRDGVGWDPPTYTGTATVGAVYLDRVSIHIANCSFIDNKGADSGGAIFCNGAGSGNSSNPTITDCVFSSNTAGAGGAVHLHGIGGQANPAITNCVFVNNSASTTGGAVYNEGLASPAVTNCVFTSNTASGTGGAIYNGSDGYGKLTNCTFYDNYPRGINSPGGLLYVRNSILWDGTWGSNFEFQSNLPSAGLSAADVFKDPANPIGPDGIWATNDDGLVLLASSPAVNAGNNAYIAGFDHDITGADRIRHDLVDIGAYEFNYPGVLATRLYVDSSNIEGVHDGLSWATAFTSVHHALSFATESDSIWVAKGTYQPLAGQVFNVDRHIVFLGGFSGTETDVSQRDRDSNPAVIKGNGAGLFHFSVSSASELDGFTLRDAVPWETPLGGGYSAGAVLLAEVGIRIAHCRFINNSGGSGGGIFCAGLGQSTFNGSSPMITECEFTSNSAWDGGAIYILGDGTVSRPVISNSVFKNNSTGGWGGAICNSAWGGDSKLVVTNSVFANNSAGQYGGAIASSTNIEFGWGKAYHFIYNSVFANNSAPLGGALATLNSEETSEVVNSTMYGNSPTDFHTRSNGFYRLKNTILWSHSSVGGGNTALNVLLRTGLATEVFIDPSNPAGQDGIWGTADDGLALKPCSPAINQGDNSYITGIEADLMGNARIYNEGTVDIGAYEYQGNYEAVVLATAGPGPICEGSDLQLSASGGVTYAWTGPNGFTSEEQHPSIADISDDQAGTYTVTVTNGSTCTGTATVDLVVNPVPEVTIEAGSEQVCLLSPLSLSTANTGPYAWTGPNGFASSEQNPVVDITSANQAGVYTLSLTSEAGCQNSDELMISVENCNDELAAAREVVVGTGCTVNNGTSELGTVSGGEPDIPCSLNSNPYSTTWFVFQAPASGNVRIKTQNILGGLTGSKLGVYTLSGTPEYNNLLLLACEDDHGGSSVALSTLFLTGLTAGTNYYIQVSTDYPDEITGHLFCVSVDEITSGMLSEGDCDEEASVQTGGSTRQFWLSLVDTEGKLIANVRHNGNSANTTFTASQYTHDGSLRSDGSGRFYLDRNWRINAAGTPGATKVTVFMTDQEFDAMADEIPGLTPGQLNLTRDPQNSCSEPSGNGNELISQDASGPIGNGYFLSFTTPSFSTFYAHTGSSALPVTLISFDGTVTKEGNQLFWSVTTTGTDADYQVEKSADAKNWRVLGQMKHETDQQVYHLADNNPGPTDYYRLRINETGVKPYYSSIIIIKRRSEPGVEIFPTLTDQFVYMKGVDRFVPEDVEIKVTDQLGRVVYVKVSKALAGNQETLDLRLLQPGLYHISVSDGMNHIHTAKIIKQ